MSPVADARALRYPARNRLGAFAVALASAAWHLAEGHVESARQGYWVNEPLANIWEGRPSAAFADEARGTQIVATGLPAL